MPAWIWVVFGLAAIAAEITRGDWYLLGVGLGALAAAPLASHPWAAGTVFVVVSGGLLAAVRPRLIGRFIPAPTPDPPQRLIGQTGVVIRAVGVDDDFGGAVDLDGRRWSAKSFWGEPIAPGTRVEVMAVEGVRLVVHPADQPLTPPIRPRNDPPVKTRSGQ